MGSPKGSGSRLNGGGMPLPLTIPVAAGALRHTPSRPSTAGAASPPYASRARRTWAEVRASPREHNSPGGGAGRPLDAPPPSSPSSSPRAANGPWLWGLMAQSEPGASSLRERFHDAYGTAGGLANGAAYNLWGHTPMKLGDAVMAHQGRKARAGSTAGITSAAQPASATVGTAVAAVAASQAGVGGPIGGVIGGPIGGGDPSSARTADGPTRAMKLAASMRARAQAALEKKAAAGRRASMVVEPPSDADWVERMGQTLRGVPRRRVHQVFDAFDTDGSGLIDAAEVRHSAAAGPTRRLVVSPMRAPPLL
jgi:hypothetical protein